MTTDWMPISELSPTVQPCSITWWPTVTSAPRVSGEPMSVCSTLPSWMLLRSPMVIHSLSPRSTAPYQTLAPAASVDAADDGGGLGHPGVGRHAGGIVADSVQGHAGSPGE